MDVMGCPVCGNPELTPYDETGATTFEICEFCRCEAGYEYNQETTEEHLLLLRREWINTYPRDTPWIGGQKASVNATEVRSQKLNQLRQAGLAIPD